ncbi:MAG: bifunctional sugar-1-phosphate nucleotidylyltransferase/acetyltransferase [Candidatus Methanospirareceae archaeon]
MKGIILAAGKGERLQPLTDYKPKAMLPVCNKPLIEYQLELLRAHGIEEIAIVVGHLKEQIEFEDVKYYEDKLIKGTATALHAARDFIDDDFILMYGDLFFDITNFSDIIDVETENAIAVVKVEDVSRYGEVVFEDGRLKGIREKTGFGGGYINAGIYHLSPSVLEQVERTEESARGEYELTDALQMLDAREKVRVVPLNGYWNDIGYPWDYIDANMHMLERRVFAVGENTEIWDSAIIRKPAVIGENCEVKNCVIDRSVIGDECVVGEFSVVKRSVVMSTAHVPHFNYVPDSVIAEGCNLGAGTKIANLRFDNRNVKMSIKGERIDSGRRKLGAIIGYNVKTGINVSIYPGVKISSGKWIEAERLVRRDI